MKLILLTLLAINSAVNCRAHEHFTFPPQYHSHPGIYSPDKLALLPPESHTPVPYYHIKNINNLPFPFLPPSGAKAPTGFPTPLPIISSTYMPIRNDDDDASDEDDKSTIQPSHLRNKNRLERNQFQRADRRIFRPISQNIQYPIDRIDTKVPFQLSGNIDQSTPNTPTMSPRSIIISDNQRHDQLKAIASFANPQYVPQPSVFVSSTTETAIPILRLSNEMDLDGSFSYEALGADQTHYVQHSRMENMGAGKEEQVVEGSYSYVGSDGKTYTTHYIADSNGFRAIGDHLPVAPPIPEIIQRSIQYNLAEESKQTPNLKSWKEEEKENEISESERRYQLSISPPRVNNLFTGKTPESFSHGISNTQNNLVAAAFNQTPIKANNDFTIDQTQSKPSSATNSPQITFLASQGVHAPSKNTPQQTIPRVFTTEKSTMPQLINYEASIKDSDQEKNKALWRWQYGINANANQNADKYSISRSSGDDDILINFSDMTPEQYTKMIKQQIEPRDTYDNAQEIVDSNNKDNQYSDLQYSVPSKDQNYNNYPNQETASPIGSESIKYPTENTVMSSPPENLSESNKRYGYEYNFNDNVKPTQTELTQTSRPKLITQQDFIPPSQIVSKSYDYAEDDFESRRSKIMNSDIENIYDVNLDVIPLKYENTFQYSLKPDTDQFQGKSKMSVSKNSPLISTNNDIQFKDYNVRDDKNDFKPSLPLTEIQVEETTTTEASLENMFIENVFLKNLLKNNKKYHETHNKIADDSSNLLVKPIEDTKNYKQAKYMQYQPSNINNENKNVKRPIDIADMLNYVSRNQFESNKIKSRPKQNIPSYKQQHEIYYYTPEAVQEDNEEPNTRKFRTIQQNGELPGVIKNYKVLQRNNNMENEDRVDRFRNNPRKSFNLPPMGRAGPSAKSYLPTVYV